MKTLEKYPNKFIAPIANLMAGNSFFGSLSEAFMRTTPITVGVALLMIVGNFPIPGWSEILINVGLKSHFDAVINVSTNALGLYVAFNFAYVYSGKYGKNQLTGALISLVHLSC